MPTSGTGPYWFVVLPAERANAISNPSFELGTAGWAGTGTGPTLGSVSDYQAFGAYSLRVTGASDGIGATATAASIGSGSAVVASAYVQIRGASGGSAQIAVGGTTSRVPVGSTWQRISVGTVNTAAAARAVAVQRFGANSGTLYVDGVQVEGGGPITTYVDGDQDGCAWLGAPHASASLRPGQTRAGGTAVSLQSLGLIVEEPGGHGAPPLVTVQQPYALADGAEYQRTRVAARPLSLVGYVGGTTTADWHAARRRLIDALKVDAVGQPAPVRLLYTGAGGTAYIDAVWDGGLEIAEMDGPMAEPAAALRLLAPDPYFRGETQGGTTLAPYTTFGSFNFVAYRDPAGVWGTMGAAGVGPNSLVTAIEPGDQGTVFVGGAGTTFGGTYSPYVAQWSGGAWGSLGPNGLGTVNGNRVHDLRYRVGTLTVGGIFVAANGTRAVGVAYWAGGAWGTYGPGSIGAAGTVYAVAFDGDGGLLVGGDFASANGSTTIGIARWQGGWQEIGSVRGGDSDVYEFAEDGAGGVVVAGQFGTAGGTAGAGGIATWRSGRWGSIGGGAVGTGYAVAVAPGRRIYAINTGGTMVEAVASGAVVAGSATPYASPSQPQLTVAYALPDGRVLAGPLGSVQQNIPTTGYALWNGYTWVPSDFRAGTATASVPDVYAAAQDAAGTLYVGGNFGGAGTVASVTTVANPASAACYPTLRLRNAGAGTARVYQLLNTTTGDGIWFNLVLSAGERADLVLEPGARGFTSNARGDILSAILPGSNLATWRLLPGTNTVSFFSDGAGVVADLYWETRHWSADEVTE